MKWVSIAFFVILTCRVLVTWHQKIAVLADCHTCAMFVSVGTHNCNFEKLFLQTKWEAVATKKPTTTTSLQTLRFQNGNGSNVTAALLAQPPDTFFKLSFATSNASISCRFHTNGIAIPKFWVQLWWLLFFSSFLPQLSPFHFGSFLLRSCWTCPLLADNDGTEGAATITGRRHR